LKAGAVQLTAALREPALALTAVGGLGTVRGMTGAEGSEAQPLPRELVATTVKV
jgi:hypothetical protein